LNIDISLLSQSSGERPDASMIVRIALAFALHGVDESALEAVATRLLRPPPAGRAGIRVVLLRAREAVGVVEDSALDVASARLLLPPPAERTGAKGDLLVVPLLSTVL
jgi:hypothetical protein